MDLLLDVLKYMRATLQAEGLQEEQEGADAPSASASASAAPGGSGAFSQVAVASLARDEGLCYFALRRYPECVESLREYMALAEVAVSEVWHKGGECWAGGWARVECINRDMYDTVREQWMRTRRAGAREGRGLRAHWS